MKKMIIAILSVLISASCTENSLFLFNANTISDVPKNISVENALKRARQISEIEWLPLHDVPNNIGYYSSGTVVKGLPYSSVKEIDKFIGIDVSIKTFMTAVHNPRSVLYTENVSKAPYHGRNCASYYGVVCSSAVNYALGIPVNYITTMLDTLSCFSKVGVQAPTEIELCDVLWSPGHEVMICEIERNASNFSIEKVSILESSGTSTRIHSYSFYSFKKRWIDDGWVLYRFNGFEDNIDIPYESNPFVPINGEQIPPYKYNDFICTSKGDYVVYREGESVTINVLDSDLVSLSLYRDSVLVEERIIESINEEFDDLQFGDYSIAAKDDNGKTTDKIHFTVVDTNVEIEKHQGFLKVFFTSQSGYPFYVKLCNEYGGPMYLRLLSKEEIMRGDAIIPINDEEAENGYCKVYFSSPNGIVTNNPIKINSL